MSKEKHSFTPSLLHSLFPSRLCLAFSVALSLTSATLLVAAESAPLYAEHQDLSYYLDADGKKHPIKTTADWDIRRKHILSHMQTVMGPLPKPKQPVELGMTVLEEKPFDVFVRQKIAYHTDSPQRVVNAYLFLPRRNAGHKIPAVLCLHQTTRIGKQEPAGLGGRPNLSYALHLASRGYVTLAPDYPSFGDYDYNFDPQDGYISGTMKAVYDNMRAIDLLVSLKPVDPQRIGCIGHSLGGHNTMFTAAFDGRIKAIVSNCGFTRFHKYFNGRLKGWTSQRYMPLIASRYNNDPDRVPFDFPEIVASFVPRPFLASSPLRDGNFEVSGVRDTIVSAKPIYQLFGWPKHLQANYPDCGHDFPPDVRKLAYEFLDKHLKLESLDMP